MKHFFVGDRARFKLFLRGALCAAMVGPLAACISFTRSPTRYQDSWGALQTTASCSGLTGRYSNVGVVAVQPDWQPTPFLEPVELGHTLAHWIKRPAPDIGDKGIEYIELNVPADGAGIDVGIHYADHVDRFLMPWNDELQCVNGSVRMERRYVTAGDLPGRGFNKEIRSFARTSRGGLAINVETSTVGGGAVLFIVAVGTHYENSWYGWPAYGDAPFAVDKSW
jgi:hypothetical protein